RPPSMYSHTSRLSRPIEEIVPPVPMSAIRGLVTVMAPSVVTRGHVGKRYQAPRSRPPSAFPAASRGAWSVDDFIRAGQQGRRAHHHGFGRRPAVPSQPKPRLQVYAATAVRGVHDDVVLVVAAVSPKLDRDPHLPEAASA